MTQLTPKSVRARAAALILSIALTFGLVIVGLVYLSSSRWWVLAAFIDIPFWILFAVLERAERSAA